MSPLIAISLALVSVVLSAIVSVKVKFAPDARTAFWDLFGLATNLVSAVGCVGVTVFLVQQYFSTEPLTRRAAVVISVGVGALVLQGAFISLRVALTVIGRAIDMQVKHLGLTEKHYGILKDLVEGTHRALSDPKDGDSE